MSSLARYALPTNSPTSVDLTSATKVAPAEFLLIYTLNAVVYAEVFKVEDPDVATVLEGEAGDGVHINALLQTGGPTSSYQPIVTKATLIVE